MRRLSPPAKTICAALEIELQILWRDAAQAPGCRRVPRGIARQCHARRRHRFFVLSAPRRCSTRVSLVGKGICFDTGGTNLKAHKSMLDMHTDMEGSAVALGSLYALKPALAAVGRLLACHYGKPHRPFRLQAAGCGACLNGTTIQVIHTDAEGRMVLADTLESRGGEEASRDHRLRHAHGHLHLCADRALQRRVHQPSRRPRT